MRIEEVSYDLLRPITTSKGKVGVRSGWIITLEEGEFSGQGEVLPLEGWSDLTIDEAYSQLVECDNSIMGTQRLSKEVQSAINTASWNLEAAKKGTSLSGLIGAGKDHVRVNALIDGSNQKNLRDNVKESRAKGLNVFKVKLGFRDDQERVELLSEIIQEGEKIRLDPNGNWSLQYAVTFLDRVRKTLGSRLEYVEDPVANLEDLMKLRSIVPVEVAVDNLWASMEDLDTIISENLGDYVVIKPALNGGIDSSLEFSRCASDNGLQTIISSTYDGPIALGAWCALAASLAPEATHGLGTADLFNDERIKHLTPTAGKVFFAS